MINTQSPVESGFDGTTTALQALAGKDLHGMTAIVTGGYSGIGLEAVRVLAGAGAQVIVPARDALKAERNLDGIAGVELGNLDLLDSASIDCFAHNFLASGRALHLLINSAGIMAPPLQRNVNGVEAQFATNHLGHFQLTARLWCGVSPLLEGMGGLYCEDCEVAVLSQDDTKRSGVRAWAIDPEQAERLWALSEQLSGVTL